MRKDLPVGDFAVDGLVIRVHQHAAGHHIAAGPRDPLSGWSGRSCSDSVRVKVAIDGEPFVTLLNQAMGCAPSQ